MLIVRWCFYHPCVGGVMSCQKGPIAAMMMYVESLMNWKKSIFEHFLLTVIQVKNLHTQGTETLFRPNLTTKYCVSNQGLAPP